jgi:magnesium transporter
VDVEEVVEFGEVHLFIGPGFVVTVRHAENPDLARVRQRLEGNPAMLALGPEAVLYAILDEVVDGYAPVVAGLENDIDEIQDQLFGGDPAVSRRIYELLREVVSFQRATGPLPDMLDRLQRGGEKYGVDIELQRALRDVQDHVLRVNDRAGSFRILLENALTVHSTLVSQQQNDEMRRLSEASLIQNEETRRLSETSLAQNEEVKKISSWAAILFAPTLVGTIYGMNFTYMPELDWPLGYPLALLAMVGGGVGLYAVFKARHWL